MAHVLIVHLVDDYEAWKAVFDAAAGIRRDAGERHFQVLRDSTNGSRVVHFSTWTSHEAARAFFESPRVAGIRRQAGVKTPAFLYLDECDTGDLITPPPTERATTGRAAVGQAQESL